MFPELSRRSFYGSVCSANNTAFLLPLRMMLLRESFNYETSEPEGLHLAQATPRQWLESEKRIIVTNAPTCFGPVSYSIESLDDAREIRIVLDVPERNPIKTLRMKLRPPHNRPLHSVHLDNNMTTTDITDRVLSKHNEHIIILDGYTGRLRLTVRFE